MVRRAVSTSPESTNHLSHHHLSQAQTPTSSTSSLSSASDGQPVSQQASPSSQQHSPVSAGGGVGGAGATAGGPGGSLLGLHHQQQSPHQPHQGHHPHQHPLHTPPPHHHVHIAPAPHENGHGGPAGTGIFIAAAPYTGEYYADHPYYYSHPEYGSPSPSQHICPVHDYGPVTLPMVSQNPTPPMAMPMQVPHGHMMQQIVDENGTLRHVILSTQPQQLAQGGVQHHMHPSFTNGTAMPFFNPIAGFQTGPGAGGPQMYPPQLIAGGANGNNGAGGAAGGGSGGTHGLHTPQGNVGHSPSPPSHTNTSYHKDERAQRQYSKMQRKLDQKQRELNASATTPINSPRKHVELNGSGGQRKSHPSHPVLPNHLMHQRNGTAHTLVVNNTPTLGASEEDTSSAPDEEEDNTQSIIVDHLSSVPSPQVTEITSRTALLQWSPPTTALTAGSAAPMPQGVVSNTVEPLPFNVQDLHYEVLLSDHGKENKYKSIFKGTSLSCKVQDLRPGQEYTVRLQVYLDQLHGTPTEPTVFNTPGCEPDVPAQPKLLARTKNTLQLRWNAPADNGSSIIHYILEYDNGKSNGVEANEFTEVVKTKGKQFQVNKLQPSTTYYFRLSAVNEFGRSGYSIPMKYTTSGNVPAAPVPPTLRHATATTLKLAWQRRSECEKFALQMNDETDSGFRNVYYGMDTQYECVGLRRATTFQFRLMAINDEGKGPFSEQVIFRTLPTCPGRPAKPQVKGKVHANGFRVKWDPPHDTGGAEIGLYHLEISSGAHYERVYTGKESEAMIERLNPGTAYQIRVLCQGPGGSSACSEPCLVTTDPVTPGQPQKPFCKSPPTPYAACLAWDKPDYNGGSPVLEYEMEMETVGTKVRSAVYKGKELFCVAKDLQPGEKYTVQVRALNRIGAGPWSEEFTFSAGAAQPETPRDLTIVLKSPTHLTVMWAEPHSNGSPISEYILQSSADSTSSPSSSSSSSTSDSDGAAPTDASLYQTVYRGASRSADVRNLHPFSRYHFRVCALNAAGSSRFSVPITQQMPAAPPNAPLLGEQKITAKSILISWQAPHDNGSPVTQYNIECGDRLLTTDALSASAAAANAAAASDRASAVNANYANDDEDDEEEDDYDEEEEASVGSGGSSDEDDHHEDHHPVAKAATNLVDSKLGRSSRGTVAAAVSPAHSTKSGHHKAVGGGGVVETNKNMLLIGDLHPETSYKLRIQAVNGIGTGPFSSFVKFTTAPLPPKPPKLECAQAGFAHLKLRWSEGKNLDLARYYVEMENSRTGEYQNVYTGSRTTCKVMKLHELTTYTFRICVETRHAGKGDFSEGFSFTTTATSPNSIKAPRVCLDPATTNGTAGGGGGDAAWDNWHGSLTIEWQTSRNNPFNDPIEYILQMAKAKDQDYHQAYRGPESRYTVSNLQYGVSYAFKVCPVRVRQNGEHVAGPFSPVLHHHLSNAIAHRASANGGTASGHRSGTDDVDGRTLFQGNVVNSRGELVLTKSAAGAMLLAGNNGYGPDVGGYHAGGQVKGDGSSTGGLMSSSTMQQLQRFFEPDSSKAVVAVVVCFLLSMIVAAFLK